MLQDSSLGSYCDTIISAREARRAEGYTQDCSDQDETDFQTSFSAKMELFIDALIGTSPTGRRRRSTCNYPIHLFPFKNM